MHLLARFIPCDRGPHNRGAFFRHHLPDNLVIGVVFFVHLHETVHKDSCCRFIPNVTRCALQMKAEVTRGATFLDLGVEFFYIIGSDKVHEPFATRC